MKRAAFFYSLMSLCLAAELAFARAQAGPDDKKVCPFNIIGMWRSEATTRSNPVYFDFGKDGWVTLMGHAADALPQDFEMITSVQYKLDKPARPKRIEFITERGNDAFVQGVTPMDVTEYGDNSFTTLNPVTGEKTRWVREQTHLYFLTFAARSGPAQQSGPAFAMWTVLNGREPKVEALGVQMAKGDEGKTAPVFGPIPPELYEQVTEDKEKDKEAKKYETIIMRFELTQAEYEATRKVYETWARYLETRALPHGDPYLNVMEFLSAAAESFNQCGEKAKLHKLSRRERDETISKHAPPQHALEFIRAMRKKNEELHVADAKFPWTWRPLIQLPVQ